MGSNPNPQRSRTCWPGNVRNSKHTCRSRSHHLGDDKSHCSGPHQGRLRSIIFLFLSVFWKHICYNLIHVTDRTKFRNKITKERAITYSLVTHFYFFLFFLTYVCENDWMFEQWFKQARAWRLNNGCDQQLVARVWHGDVTCAWVVGSWIIGNALKGEDEACLRHEIMESVEDGFQRAVNISGWAEQLASISEQDVYASLTT